MNKQQQTIMRTLDAHGIEYKVSGGRIFAADDAVCFGRVSRTWRDVSEFSTRELLLFLGY